MLHHLDLGLCRKADAVDGDPHTVEPCITGSRVDFDMGVHGAYIRMTVLFYVELRATEEP